MAPLLREWKLRKPRGLWRYWWYLLTRLYPPILKAYVSLQHVKLACSFGTCICTKFRLQRLLIRIRIKGKILYWSAIVIKFILFRRKMCRISGVIVLQVTTPWNIRTDWKFGLNNITYSYNMNYIFSALCCLFASSCSLYDLSLHKR